MRLFILFILLYLISCKSSVPISEHTLDFNSFTITTPSQWTKIKIKGIDSYVGRIALNDTDTLEFDLGYYSNKLDDYDPDDYDKRIDPKLFAKNKILWDTIDGFKTKFVLSTKPGAGVTGIYIDSLSRTETDVIKFNLYGFKLSKANQKAFVKAAKTLKFTKKQ